MKHEILYAIHPVIEALKANRRKIAEIFLSRRRISKRLKAIEDCATLKKVPVRRVSDAELNKMSPEDHHQGVTARVDRFPLTKFGSFTAPVQTAKNGRLLILLDGIVDPHNLGAIIRTALGQMPELKIFGSDYPTEDGTCVRDYIHVLDLADAHVRAITRLFDGELPNGINLGAGRGVSVLQVIDQVRQISGCEVPTTLADRRPGDPPRLVADITLAENALGWRPTQSDMENIVRTAWSWHKDQLVISR